MRPVVRPAWGTRAALAAGGIVAVLVALAAAGVLGGAAAATASTPCPTPPHSNSSAFSPPVPVPLAKPPATVGLTQTIYWNLLPTSDWFNNGVTGHGYGGFAYIVNITNLRTCQTKSIHVPGGTTVDQFTVSESAFPAAANAIDGTSFAYRLSSVQSDSCGLSTSLEAPLSQRW